MRRQSGRRPPTDLRLVGRPTTGRLTPVSSRTDPPLTHFLASLEVEKVCVQVWIARLPDGGFELRHQADRHLPPDSLRPMALVQLHALAQKTDDGQFRPLRSSPDLARGWRALARNPAELGQALDQLYPGFLADAWSLETGRAQPMSWDAYLHRQLGRARALATFAPVALADAIDTGCAPHRCLRRRTWSAPLAIPPDPAAYKSSIPCLEPCPVWRRWALERYATETKDPSHAEP